MAEETLVKEVLTDQMIAAGAELLRGLDREGWPVVASLWLFEPENNQWRLVLASPVVPESGPREAYRHVSEALHAVKPALSLGNVSVVSPQDPLIRALASAYGTSREIEGRRVSRSAINGHFVEDAYLYRLLPLSPAA